MWLLCWVALSMFVLWSVRRKRLLVLTTNVPSVSGELPLIGHAHQIIGDSTRLWNFFTKMIAESSKKGNGVAKIWLGPSLYIVVCEPEMALRLSNTCLKKPYMYSFLSPWLGDGLLTANVPKWKQHRKLLNPTFRQHILNEFLVVFNKHSSNLVKSLGKEVGNGEFDLWPYVDTTALETICESALGVPFIDDTKKHEYLVAAHKMFSISVIRTQTLWWHFDFIYRWSNVKKIENDVIKVLKRTSYQILCSKRKEKFAVNADKTGRQLKAFLDHLLVISEESSLTDEEVQEEVDTIIEAGFHTVAISLIYTLALLGSYPQIQDRVFDEITELFGNSNSDVTKEDLLKLVYLEAVIKESLRLYPVAPLVIRTADENVKFDNFTVPAGSGLLIFLWGINRHRCWGEDADVFRPERWLDASSISDIPAAAFAAFSLGKRACIGKQYAMMSMKTTLVHVLRKYRVTSDISRLKLKFEVTIQPTAGHHIALHLRK